MKKRSREIEIMKKEINGNFRTENALTKIKHSLNWVNNQIKNER